MEQDMTSINETVDRLAREAGVSGHRAVEQLKSRLNAREDLIRTRLRRYAGSRGLSNADIENLFIEVGLAERPAPVAPSGRVEEAIYDIRRQVAALHERLNNLCSRRRTMLPITSGEFRLVADPELKFSASGMPIASLRLVASSRKKNEAGEWVDDKTCWLNAVAFKKVAENIAESLAKGDHVNVSGKLQTQNWEDKEGNKRSSYSIVVDTIGPSLAFAPAKSVQAERTGAAAPASDNPWEVTPAVADDDTPPPF
jgi:single-strand DNA-binding protein